MKNKLIMFWVIVAITIASIVVICLNPPKLGLDLIGGSRLTLEAKTTDTLAKITPEVMDRLKFAIENWALPKQLFNRSVKNVYWLKFQTFLT